MTEPPHRLRESLSRLAEESRPPRIPDNLWNRGRRREWRRRAAGGLALVVGLSVLLAVGFGTGARPLLPAVPTALVPSTVEGPLPFTRTVLDAPAGPAALLVSGTGAFAGSALLDDEGSSLVVGRNRSYRVARTVNDVDAGDRLLLSPDGRSLAGDMLLEGSPAGAEQSTGTTLVDLSTGAVRSIPGGAPLAWAPDGRHLVTGQTDPASQYRLAMLDLATGTSRDLFPVSDRPTGGSVAFAPDGRRLAIQTPQSLTVYDLDTLEPVPVPLGAGQRLAGPGAWTSDGRLAIWDVTTGSGDDPSAMTLRLLDPTTGGPAESPSYDPALGLAAWLLGWQADGSAVIETFHGALTAPGDPIDATRSVRLEAHHPGGGRTSLVSLPPDATRVEVAHDLLDHFGGPPAPTFLARLGEVLRGRVLELGALGLIIAGAVTLVGWYRRRPGPRLLAAARDLPSSPRPPDH